MDPVTQGVLGGIAAQSCSRKNTSNIALLSGFLGGMAADLDIIIRSDTDPLLKIEYHRHFTHSLVFIPVGGLIIAAFLYFLLRKKHSFKTLYIFSTIGYATHGLLDTCTSYGTYLLWPFSTARKSFDLIAIIDVAFTASLLLFLVLSFWKKSAMLARVGLGVAAIYLSVSFSHGAIVRNYITQLAGERGHKIERYRIMPTWNNIVLWRSIYEYDGSFYFDSVYTSPFAEESNQHGGSVEKLNIEKDFPNLSPTQKNDIKRFSHFADGFVAKYSDDPLVIGDFRYGRLPHEAKPKWGIKIKPGFPDEHVERVRFGD